MCVLVGVGTGTAGQRILQTITGHGPSFIFPLAVSHHNRIRANKMMSGKKYDVVVVVDVVVPG